MNEKYYYSATTNAFYPSALIPDYIEAGTLPEDLLEISVDLHTYLLNCQAMGKQIRSNELNRPVASEPLPPTPQELRNIVDGEKTRIMREVSEKIDVLKDAVELGISTREEEKILSAWQSYRVLVSRVEPDNPVWPEKPLN